MVLRALIVAAVTAALLPSAALAVDVRVQARDEPVFAVARTLSGGERTLAPRPAPFRFNLVGVHWQGEGRVSFRTRDAAGGWSGWLPAQPEDEDLPDAGSGEDARRSGWRLGNPWWTGGAVAIQYRLEGEVSRLRAYFLDSRPGSVRAPAAAGAPAIVPRSSWRADESIVRSQPSYASRVRFAVVHHTAGRNDYGPAESAAIVRGIQAYHVKANGWNDIGYNFLVDRYGQVFEGRAGGIDRNVVGAHARGFNTGSVGVAILGSHQGTDATPAAESALASLLAWRLDVAHVDPLSTVTVVSGGNERFAPGAPVDLRAVSGHRDTGLTQCPGERLYGRLPALAEAVAAIGLPKLYEPAALPSGLTVRPDGTYQPVLVTARLSDALPWTAIVVDERTGATVASTAGAGSEIAWSWDGNGLDARPVDPAGRYAVTISAGGALPARLALSAPRAAPLPPPPADLTDLAVEPASFSPNGDGQADVARITFTLPTRARVRVRLESEAGAKSATILPERWLGPGPAEVTFAGATQKGAALPDGRYAVVVVARGGGTSVTRSVALAIDRTVSAFRVAPRALSPNGDGRHDRLAVSFALSRPADVAVRLARGAATLAVLAEERLEPGRHRFTWEGARGAPLADGGYDVVVDAVSELSTSRLAAAVTVDTRAPALAVLSARTRGGTTRVRVSLSERARVRVWSGSASVGVIRRAGRSSVAVRSTAPRARVRAWDAAGNPSRLIRITPRR